MTAWKPENGTRLGVMPRLGGADDITWYETETSHIQHFWNAWVEGDRIEGGEPKLWFRVDEEEARVLLYEHERVSAESRKQIENRLWTAQQRVIDLEQAIAARRAELETWQGEIDRVLGLP